MDELLIELKPSELSVLMLVAKGYTNKGIAEEMHLSPKTVEHMLGNYDARRAIYPKIGVCNRAQAAAWYIEKFGLPGSEIPPTVSSSSLVDIVATSPYFLAQTNDTVETLYKVRLHGNPQLAIDLANTATMRIRDVLRRVSSIAYCRPLYRDLALIMLEQGRAYREIASHHEVLPVAWRITREVRLIAKEYSDKDLWALADCHIADAYYILGDAYSNKAAREGTAFTKQSDHASQAVKCLSSSVHYLTRALEALISTDSQLWALRTLAVSWAYLDEDRRFEAVVAKVKSIIENGAFSRIDEVCAVLEGIARGYSILRRPEASLLDLERSLELYSKLRMNKDHSPFLGTQQSRTHIELILAAKPLDRDELERVGVPAIEIAKEHNYQRHAHYMNRLLERAL
ncbi:MAG TPA: helix-turn-helix transcriptional regulator [Chloroflexia bacterium]|jgi:DNA-binding CsgD family transcriptional regulator